MSYLLVNQEKVTPLVLRTAAEKYAETTNDTLTLGPPNDPNFPSRNQGGKEDDDDPASGDILKLNLNEANGILRSKTTISDSSTPGRKICSSIEPYLTCAKCSRVKQGVLKGNRKSIKKQHVIQHFMKKINKRINKYKNAVVMDGFADLTLTYKELDELSNSIAHNLIQLKFSRRFDNFNPDGYLIIAVYLPICYEYIIILLGILKLGAAILPISIEYPLERITEVIKLTRPILIISNTDTDPVLEQVKQYVQMESMKVEDLWDMIYSGTYTATSQPVKTPIQSYTPGINYPPMWKRPVAVAVIPSDSQDLQAVVYDSRCFLNRISWESHIFVYITSEHCLLPPSFDTIDHLADVIVQLCMGVTLVGIHSPIEYSIPDTLFQYCEKYKIKRLSVWPTLLKACTIMLRLFEDFLPMVSTVRYWMCAGGCVRSELASMFFELPLHPLCQLVHMYHFEDCTGALTFQIFENMGSMKSHSFYARLSVGEPVTNTDIYILDENMNLVKDGESGRIYVNTAQAPVLPNMTNFTNSYYGPNPFSKKKGRELLIDTLDFGRIAIRSNGTRVLVHEITRDKHYYSDNHIVWLLHIDMYLERLTTLVKQFHTICYRPNEDDQTFLAFCVLHSNKTSSTDVENQLQECLPVYMIPEVVVVAQIPTLPDRDKPDENYLLKLYIEERLKRQKFSNWGVLGIKDKFVLHAAKILIYVIYALVGIPIAEIIGTYWLQPYLNLRRATVTRATFIVKELHSNRYPLYTDEFIASERLKDIPEMMVEARRERGFCNKNCPPEEVFFIKNRYKLEILVNSSRLTVCSILAKVFTKRDQLDYYAEVECGEMRKFFDSIWPVFVRKRLSILIRRKNDRKKVVGAVLNMNWHDEIELSDGNVPKNIGYKLELIRYLETSLTDAHFPQDKTRVLQVCYIGLDANLLTPFEIHGLTDKIIRSMLIIGKVKGFEALVVIAYDYFTMDICVNNYSFNVSKQCQISQFVAADGTRPYQLCPDTMYAYLCWKSLLKVEKADTQRFQQLKKPDRTYPVSVPSNGKIPAPQPPSVPPPPPTPPTKKQSLKQP